MCNFDIYYFTLTIAIIILLFFIASYRTASNSAESPFVLYVRLWLTLSHRFCKGNRIKVRPLTGGTRRPRQCSCWGGTLEPRAEARKRNKLKSDNKVFFS